MVKVMIYNDEKLVQEIKGELATGVVVREKTKKSLEATAFSIGHSSPDDLAVAMASSCGSNLRITMEDRMGMMSIFAIPSIAKKFGKVFLDALFEKGDALEVKEELVKGFDIGGVQTPQQNSMI